MKIALALAILVCGIARPAMAQTSSPQKSQFTGSMSIVPMSGNAPAGLSVMAEAKRELTPKDKSVDTYRYLWARATVKNSGKNPVSGTVVFHYTDGAATICQLRIPVVRLLPGKTTVQEELRTDLKANVAKILRGSWEWQPAP